MSRVRRYARFVRELVGLHPKLFATAVAGAFVFAVFTVASSMAIEWVIDEVVLPAFEPGGVDRSTVVAGCALVIGVGMIRAAGVVIRRVFAGMTQWRVAETLSNRVSERFVRQPAGWHRRQSDGQLVARAGVDVETGIGALAPIPFAVGTVLLIFVAAAYLLAADPLLGAVAVAVFPVLTILNIVYQQRVEAHFDRAQQALGEFSGAVHESFEAVQLVKAYGAGDRETQRLSEMAARIRDARIRAVHLRGTFEAFLESIPSLTNIGLVVLGANRVQSGELTIGELSGFIFMFTLLVFPLRVIGFALSELPHADAGYRRVKAVLDEPIEPDPLDTIGHTHGELAVRLEGASYTYPGDSSPVVAPADLLVPRGTVTAIVGATGAGKSTMVDLIGGVLAPTTGTVSITPGVTAIVFQEAFLFGGTVRDNVAVGLDVTDEQVWEALGWACADGFVRELPDELATTVGERGVTLSGGQRQRIALARALIRRPALLLLDDTTSALDPATELAVLDNLRTALETTTIVMVASRPSTIALADDVLFMAQGRILDHGKHERLVIEVPAYRALVEAFETDRATPAGGAT